MMPNLNHKSTKEKEVDRIYAITHKMTTGPEIDHLSRDRNISYRGRGKF